MSPDSFFAAIEQGCELGPTDKNYKVYIDLIEEHPEELKVVSAGYAKEKGWVKADPVLLKRDGWGEDYKWMKVTPRGSNKFGKFYFQHFSAEECQKFINLLNSKKLKIGYPGHFYVLPFFIATRQRVL